MAEESHGLLKGPLGKTGELGCMDFAWVLAFTYASLF